MRNILISIQPQWVEKILNGEKTIEIRKTMPKCDLPCKVYIYCTQGQILHDMKNEEYWTGNRFAYGSVKSNNIMWSAKPFVNGKVVAEFTLNEIEKIKFDCPCSFRSFNFGFGFTENRYNIDIRKTSLTESELYNYLGEPFEIQGEYHQTFEFNGYAWHIDNLKIYDKPKELSEFTHNIPDYSSGVVMYSLKQEPLKRPPQSWCYVEEIQGD